MKPIVLTVAALALIACTSGANAEEIRIATGHTFIKRVFDPIRSAFRQKTGIDIRITFNDPVPALVELEKGNADAAGASLTVTDWLEQANQAGTAVKEPSAYSSYVPVTEKSMVVVHIGNKVQGLSKEQLKGIFSGRIRNWQEVGGSDAPILVVWPSLGSGALFVFRTKIMDNEPITRTVYDVETLADTPDAVAATPEAIGIITGTAVQNGLKEAAPAIERPLTLLYKGKPSQSLQKLLDFLKTEGRPFLQ